MIHFFVRYVKTTLQKQVPTTQTGIQSESLSPEDLTSQCPLQRLSLVTNLYFAFCPPTIRFPQGDVYPSG